MENLWTPWRFHYISNGPPDGECVFCNLRDEDLAKDRDNLIISRHHSNYVVLNRYPYTSGHTVVVVNRHVATLEEVEPTELNEMMDLARSLEVALKNVYQPDGFNVGFNLGECAGAGVAGHLHLHIVPRWIGDSNMVSVLGQTRIIPEALESTFDKLEPLLQKR